MKGDNARAGYLLYKESGHWSRCGLASSLCLPSHPLSSGVPLGQIKEDHFPILTQVAYQLIISLMMYFVAVSSENLLFLPLLLFPYISCISCLLMCFSTCVHTHLMPFCIMSRQIPCRLEWIKIVHFWKRSLRRKKPPYMCLMLCKVLCSIGLNLSYFIWVLWER